jgi:serine protease Do
MALCRTGTRSGNWTGALAAALVLAFWLLLGAGQVVAQDDENKPAGDQAVAESTEAGNENAPGTPDPKTAAFDFFGESSPVSVEQLREMQAHFAELAKKVADATVNVQVGNSQGSGVIVTRDGYVMTAAHVIGGANQDATIVLNDGTSLAAKTLGLNRTIDSGLLKITEKRKYPYLSPGESASLKSGQWVMAIGHPGGLDQERGLVYRIGRILRNSDDFISTDCSLVGGDSGGPLVDMDGNVIGIHSRIGPSLSSNIHVPVDVYSADWDELVSARDWGRGIGGENPANEPWIGLSFEGGTLKVENVSDSGPAARAGIQAGDTILEFNGTRTSSQRRFASIMRDLEPGKTVKVKLKRGDAGEELELELVIGSRADDRQ